MHKLAIIQAASVKDFAKNVDTMHRFVKGAQVEGCEAVCFPEAFLTSYAPEDAGTLAIESQSYELQAVSKMAQEENIDILAGFMECDGKTYHITHGVFLKNGECDFYRKTHLGQKEKKFFKAGNELKSFNLSCGLPVGIQLCGETHYHEITQTLVLKGAEVIFAPYAVPKVSGCRSKIWSKYIPARSYDNRVYVACCNLCDGQRFGGGIMVCNPDGEIIEAFFEEKEHLLTFDVNRNLFEKYRSQEGRMSLNFYPVKRRKELYL